MKSDRHPHPHVDPRQPRDGTAPGTNPPVFAWKPPEGADGFALTVARDEGLTDVVLDEGPLAEPVCLPEKAFEPGSYYWRWSAPAAGAEGEIFRFDISADAVVLEVPSASEWLRRLPDAHPRIYVRPDEIPELRASAKAERAGLWKKLKAHAERLLKEEHELAEPPFLPSRQLDYEGFFKAWYKVLMESRRFMTGAETLALAYLASGESKYARAACRRIASVSTWDPMGSSHISHNDEAHMSIVWHGPQACDWVWDEFTADERAAVVEQFRRRGEITYEHMHDKGSYGVSRFDSHAGREIVFLAQIAFVFHEQIPEAAKWLEWLRPVLCGIWPIWAGDDGGWAEGPSYGLAYVNIMSMFATALKRGADVDLYRRPFWKGHAEWRLYCLPPYAEWMGFGDHTERWGGTWNRNADLVDLIDRETGAGVFGGYVAEFRSEAEKSATPDERKRPNITPLGYLAAPAAQPPEAPPARGIFRVFDAAGLAGLRTDLDDPELDVAFLFRSCPYGAVSHSHASNNDFIIHVGGKVMAMPSGYYDGYGSDHHAHWNWHTKSHNCVTLSGASQLMRSHDSLGRVANPFEDEWLVYMVGVADASCAMQAERCRRHVIYLKEANCFVLIDEFVPKQGVASALQWNIHSWAEFDVDEETRSFVLRRDSNRLAGHFMYHANSFFSLSEGWDPPPMVAKRNDQWHPQHHLRFTASGLSSPRNLGVVLAPASSKIRSPKVTTELAGQTELARLDADVVFVNQGPGIDHEGVQSDALAVVITGGGRYEVTDAGVALA